MKNQILVPTDFSEYADFAAGIAMQIAQRFDATVHFLTIWDLPPNQVLKDKKKAALAAIQAKYNTSSKTVKTVYIEGKFIKTINQYIQDNAINLVVMGSHGTSGFNEVIIGSNTQKVVRHIHAPILVIKQPLETVDFKNIVYASDFSLNDQTIFEHFLAFIKMFSAPHIHLVAINTSSFFNQPEFLLRKGMTKFSDLAKDVVCTKHIEYSYNVENGIEHFANAINADLIVVSNYQKTMLRKLFVGSTVEALVNHSEIPVLSLDFEM